MKKIDHDQVHNHIENKALPIIHQQLLAQENDIVEAMKTSPTGMAEITIRYRVFPEGKVLGYKSNIGVIAVVKKSTDSIEGTEEDPDQMPLTQPDGDGGESPVPQPGEILPSEKAGKVKRGRKPKKVVVNLTGDDTED